MGKVKTSAWQSRGRVQWERYVAINLLSKYQYCKREHTLTNIIRFLTAESSKAFKTSFDSTVGILRWLGTNGLRFFLQFWYSKQALFWLSRGWVPGYVEWILAFPRAPTGSISIQVWGAACASIIQLVSMAILAGWTLVGGKTGSSSGTKQPMPMEWGSGGPEGKKGTSATSGEKKELWYW